MNLQQVNKPDASRYPSLSDYHENRASFIKRLALGVGFAAATGAGLIGCDQSESAQPALPPASKPAVQQNTQAGNPAPQATQTPASAAQKAATCPPTRLMGDIAAPEEPTRLRGDIAAPRKPVEPPPPDRVMGKSSGPRETLPGDTKAQ